MAANPVPQLANAQPPVVDSLCAELSLETRGRGRFATSSGTDLYDASETLVRYRLGSMTTIRQTDRDARRMFPSDLRGHERRPPPEMQPTTQPLAHFAPQISKARHNANGPPFEEAVSPQRLRGDAENPPRGRGREEDRSYWRKKGEGGSMEDAKLAARMELHQGDSVHAADPQQPGFINLHIPVM